MIRKPYRVVIGSFLALILLTSAYQLPDEDPLVVFRQINQEVLQHSQAYETLSDACLNIGHRLTGSRNGQKAEEYTSNLFKKYGFTDTKFMPFEVETWMRDTVTLAVVPNKSDNFREVPVVSLAHSPVEARVKGAIIDVGNGLEPDFIAQKDKIKGKIVLVNIGLLEPIKGARNLHRSEKTALAIQYGATGVIMVNTVKGNILLTGTASVTGSLIPIPSVCISLESGKKIREWIKEEKLHALIDMHNFSKVINARNVIATHKGSDRKLSKEKIIVGGHLDSWDLAQGAMDNGIGSFSIMDIARTFKALNLKTKRTIEFVMFMGEEQGLLGSRAMVKELTKTGDIDKIKYVLNLDMANNAKGFNVAGREEMIPFFKEISEQIKQIDPTYPAELYNQAGLHSDHQPFMLAGIPTAAPTGTIADDAIGCYHANCDKINLIKKQDLQNTVRYTAMLLYALANLEELPAQKHTSEQTRDFLIKQNLKRELILGKDWHWEE
jgi:carboxypeptidase Q